MTVFSLLSLIFVSQLFDKFMMIFNMNYLPRKPLYQLLTENLFFFEEGVCTCNDRDAANVIRRHLL